MKLTTLDNGLQIYTKNIDFAKTVTFSIYVKAGSYQEKDHLGIAHFIEHMVFKGTEKRNAEQIMSEIENIGGVINAATSFNFTKYYATVPAENWKVAADVISDIVWNHTLPDDELELERKVIQEELKMYSDDPRSKVVDMIFTEMHPSYKNRQLIGGTVKTVSEIKKEHMIEFIDNFYQPSNVFLVVSGNVEHDEVVNFMSKIANNISESGYKKPSEEKFQPDILSSGTVSLERNIEQAHFSWGIFAPSMQDDDSIVIDVIATLLGGSSSSRLYQLIREKRGLAYTVDVSYDGLDDSGFIIGYVGLEQEKIEEVKEIVVSEFEKLIHEDVTDEELKRTISFKKGTHIIGLERPSAINSFIGNAIINKFSPDPDEYIAKIESVTKEDIKRVAEKYFRPDNWQFAEIIPN